MTFNEIGKTQVAKWLAGSSATAPTHIALGTDNTTPTTADTVLGNEVGRVAIDTTTRSGNLVTYEGTFLSTQLIGDTIREIGLFDDSTAGNCYFRTTIADLAKTNNFEILVVITLQVKS